MDYLIVLNRAEKNRTKSQIVKKAFDGKESGGLRIIEKDELLFLNNGIYKKIGMNIIDTPKARPTDLKYLDRAMAVEYARPLFNEQNQVEKVMLGGKGHKQEL